MLWTYTGDASAPPLPEETENGPTATRYYSLNGLRVAKATNGAFTWIHSDHLHSATILTDESGAEVRRLAYRAFGEELENTGTGTAPKYSYTGKELDSSGLMYYGARYYDPALSRFITPDTLYDVGPQGLNRYSYALNNPIWYNDPSGHTAIALDVANLIERNQAIREHVDVLPNFLLDIFLPVTSEDVASGIADQIFGCVGVISGPGKKAAEEAAEGIARVGKETAKEVLEKSDEMLEYSTKVAKEGLEGNGDEVIEGVSKKILTGTLAKNRLNHIFGKQEHNLSGLVKKFGSEETAFNAVQNAANEALRAGKLTPNSVGILPSGDAGNIINVGGTMVRLIGGKIKDGVVQISSFSMKGLQ